MSSSRLVASAVVCAIGLMLAPNPVSAQVVKPFKISGGGPVPNGLSLVPGVPSIHFATGTGTNLGHYSCTSFFTFLSPTTFASAPYCIFTAANGDVLVCTYGDVNSGAAEPGTVTLSPAPHGRFTASFVAEFRPVPSLCTGKFANLIEGSWIMYAKSSPFSFASPTQSTPFTYTWEGKGEFTYKQKK